MNYSFRVFQAKPPNPVKGHENVLTGSSEGEISQECPLLTGLQTDHGEYELLRSLESVEARNNPGFGGNSQQRMTLPNHLPWPQKLYQPVPSKRGFL